MVVMEEQRRLRHCIGHPELRLIQQVRHYSGFDYLSYDIIAGNIYIADTYTYRIRKVTASTGIITTIAGTGTSSYTGDGGDATSATFKIPIGIAIDSSGDVYVSDWGSHCIRKITMISDIITASPSEAATNSPTIAPTYTPTTAPSTSPSAVTPRPSNIPTAIPSITPSVTPSALPSTKQPSLIPSALPSSTPSISPTVSPSTSASPSISLSGVIVSIAGTGTASFSGDGGVSTSATLYGPEGVTVDAAG